MAVLSLSCGHDRLCVLQQAHRENRLTLAFKSIVQHNNNAWKVLGRQRLEFLGDAVLDFVAGAWVYRHYPDFDEGRMTRLRASLVRTETLAQLASQVGIGQSLRLGHGEEEAGGRERDANLCDAFEALTGALYLDGGLEIVEAFVEPLIGPVAKQTLAAEADTAQVPMTSGMTNW